MAAISSAGNITIPAVQPTRRQNERSVVAPDGEKTVTQEQPVQRVNDEKSTKTNNSQKTSGEQQEIEVAQQEAQRTEFNQQTIQLPQTESSLEAVRKGNTDNESTNNNIQREAESVNKSAIDTFNKFQNINAVPRQGQELNQFV